MLRKKTQNLTVKEIESLLNKQTTVILDAVDDKILKNQQYVGQRISVLEKRLDKMELRISQKFDHLATTLDRFLKSLTDSEDEFSLMKSDLNRIKVILKEKLGVTLD